MAKASFAKLNLKTNTDIQIFEWNEQKIEVKQYLPLEEKIDLITSVIQLSHDPQNNFANPMKIDAYLAITAIEKYTNLNITEKQKEDPQKFYDALISSGFWSSLRDCLGSDFKILQCYLNQTVSAFYSYRTSALGILDTISTDYTNLELDASEIQKKIADPNNMAFLKDVLTKMG